MERSEGSHKRKNMHKEEPKITCPIFQNQETVIKDINDKINMAKGVREKAIFAEEDIRHPVHKEFYTKPEVKKISELTYLKDLNNIDANFFIYGKNCFYLSFINFLFYSLK